MTKRLKKGEVGIREVPFTKSDFIAVPQEDRVLFFMAAQTANELAMLRSMILQTLDSRPRDKALKETRLGLVFFFARQLAGRVTEGWEKLFRSEGKDQQFQRLWEKLPQSARNLAMKSEVEDARNLLKAAFDEEAPILRRVRNKLAFHFDKSVVAGAFDILPDDVPLNDFHTGRRGSTFYGGADTVMALAASHLIGSADPTHGMDRIVEEANRLGGALEIVIDAYLCAFVIHYFGEERLKVPERAVRFSREGVRSQLCFYADIPSAPIRP